ncbi:MAG: hypothetical protein A3G24_24310 [Betaproteobacteria bacterium RIFCSPLOWO2_12_FULL_62_13]|nr:MAG: hypothetical protein A3G24_24310 [Betaproteobacteria bacterium RIFCSPLOWO2_12_FULL_62_13]
MELLSVLVIMAMLATMVCLASGIASMVTDGEVAHLNSAQWMVRRVGFQAAAFLLILLGIWGAW